MQNAILAIFICCAAALAQTPENVFQLRVGPGITGTERFSVVDAASGEGHVVTCKASLAVPGSSSETQQTFTLNPRWEPQKYNFQTESGGLAQHFEAWQDGSKFKLKGSVGGGKSTEKTIPVNPHAILIDNLVACHFQAVLNRIAKHFPGEETDRDTEWWLIVPQALTAVPARITVEGEADGLLNGKQIHLKRFRLQAQGVSEDILADANTLSLQKVTIASQGVEMTREGFQLIKPGGSPSCADLDVKFRSAGFSLPGTLCLPRKPGGPFPIVVLVAGVGPHDRDETIGQSKPFRDIAAGLAAQGIATLRYDKRGHAFPRDYIAQKQTVEADSIMDAVAAVESAGKQEEIDPKRVFLLGHSTGGQLAPLIASRAGNVAGIILLSASARPLEDVILDQAEYQAKQAGMNPDSEQLKQLRDEIVKLREGKLEDATVILGAPVSYWREFRNLHELEAMQKLSLPVLFLEGQKDLPVRQKDFDIWMKALADKPENLRENHVFPNLGLLFMPGVSDTGPDSAKVVTVPREVTDAIAEWIKKQKQ